MTSTTRNRFGEFGLTSGITNSDRSRTFQGTSIGQNYPNSTSLNGGIWSPQATIGSGLKTNPTDNHRTQVADTSVPDTPDGITGSGSLPKSSELDTWSRPKTSQWPSMNEISTGLPNMRTSHNSTSPVRHRNSNQNGRSSSPYFSVNQPIATAQSIPSKATAQSYLDPASGSFKTPSAFDSHHSSRHNSDETNRRPLNSIVFGSNENGYSNTSNGFSGYNSSTVSRSGSIPPSRRAAEYQSQISADGIPDIYNAHIGPSESVSGRPTHSSRTSTYSSNGNHNHRHTNQTPSLQFGELGGSFGKLELGKDHPIPSYSSSYHDLASHAGNSSMSANSAHNSTAYRGNQISFDPDGRQGSSYNPYNTQFGDLSSPSPNGNDFQRSQDNSMYSGRGSPPLGEHQRTNSSVNYQSQISNGPTALLQKKLRGLQEQQKYLQPQLNPVQFRPSYSNPYDYNVQHMLRMNPQAQYYPMAGMDGYPPRITSRPSTVVSTNVSENLRSSLLEEFRTNNKGNKRYELKDIHDHVVEFSGDQHGSRFIQQKLETANSDEKDQIFREVLPNSLQLTTDVFGNYVIQKFFSHGNQSQKKILAASMKGHVLDLSLQTYGCRVVQKAFEHILVDQQASLVKELEHQVLKCVKDQNGNHVVQKAIERIPAEHIQFIINAFTGQVHGLATHPYGCRVIQRMLEHCQEPARSLLLEELHCCASNLIVDQYGNYVTQHVIEHGRPEDRAKIISLITGQLIMYSKHKFASNVVEKSIQFGTEEQRRSIVRILGAVDEKGESPLQQLMRDQYGNYVIQKLLAQFKDNGPEYEMFVNQIKIQIPNAKRFSYGKQVGAIEKLVYSASTPFPHILADSSPPSQLDTSAAPTPPLLTEDTQSPQTSSLPSTNTSTVDGPIGNHKPSNGISVEVVPTTTP